MEPALRRAAAGVAALVVMALAVWGFGAEYPGAFDWCWGDGEEVRDGSGFRDQAVVASLLAAPFVVGAWGAWAVALGPGGRRAAAGAVVLALVPLALVPLSDGQSVIAYLLPALGWALLTAGGSLLGLAACAAITAGAVAAAARASPPWQARWSGVLFALALTAAAAHAFGVATAIDGPYCD